MFFFMVERPHRIGHTTITLVSSFWICSNIRIFHGCILLPPVLRIIFTIDSSVNNNYYSVTLFQPAKECSMSITITVTDPSQAEALRLADYFFEIAGYGKHKPDDAYSGMELSVLHGGNAGASTVIQPASTLTHAVGSDKDIVHAAQ
jgi:hypothetical protein